MGGSILVAIFNGGPPGVIYEFIVVSLFYWTIAASVAELASAIPSSAGVYHWASVTPGLRRGRPIGFFAGWWNYLAWMTGLASMVSILANTLVQMYALNHPGFEIQSWHVFVTYALATWLSCAVVCLANRIVPSLNQLGLLAIIGGFLVTVIVVTVMPGRDGRPPHATSSFVWSEWNAAIGYPDGFVFVAGMLNGAYSVGAVDVVTHLAEEIPYPSRNIPIAMLLQYGIGFITGFAYLVSIMYAIHDFDALFESSYPIAEIYRQATGSAAGATGLLALVMFCMILAVIGLNVTTGRTLWALARDGAAPFPSILGRVDSSLQMPFWSTVISAALVTVLGLIYLGNTTAFTALVGSFILTSTSSYIAAILPNLLTGRKNISYGPFHMKGWLGFVVNGISCAYMMTWFVIYCLPYYLPTDAASMNYSSLIWGGFTIFIGAWWFCGAKNGYQGPKTTGGLLTEAEKTR
ncbi:amino acid permease [Stachybotrys elegans]|uniref:Amino acid permease n=1 Tax=Stachybotrys elegans TaxID=80388 RepID=A0A8K0SFE1_9HYPO|nr:amino acid permease [Stachybotrys elegans]